METQNGMMSKKEFDYIRVHDVDVQTINTLKVKFTDLQTEKEKQITERNNIISEKEKQIATQDNKILDYENRIIETEKKLKNFQTINDTMVKNGMATKQRTDAEISTLENTVKALNISLSGIRKSDDERGRFIFELKGIITDLEAKVKSKDRLINELQNYNIEADLDIQQKDEIIADLTLERDSRKQRGEQNAKIIDRLTLVNNKLQEQQKNNENEIKALKEQSNALLKKVSTEEQIKLAFKKGRVSGETLRFILREDKLQPSYKFNSFRLQKIFLTDDFMLFDKE